MPTKRKRASNGAVIQYRRRWSDLPIDLLCSVLHLLPIKDVIRFGAVCPHWRSAFTTVKKKLSFGPSLMLEDEITRANTFANDFNRPIIIGSSNGWLITLRLRRRGGSYDQVHMLNPHTGAQLQLPPAPVTHSPFITFSKAIVVPPSPAREEYMVATTTYMLKSNHGLAVAQAGGDRWTFLEAPPLLKGSGVFKDINYNDGMLYAVCNNGNVAQWQLSSNETPILKQVVRAPELKPYYSHRDHKDLYIVPGSQHGLLLVARYGRWYNGIDPLTYMFDVFTLGSEEEWERITCLRECTLFVGGCSQSMCLSAMDLPKLKKDCIYFPWHLMVNLFRAEKQSRGMSFLYSLEDGKVYKDNLTSDSMRVSQGNQTSDSMRVSPIWVMPNLK